MAAVIKTDSEVVKAEAAETVEATSAGMMEASTDRVGSEAECLVATSVVDKTEAEEMEAEEMEAEEMEEEETEVEETEEEMVAISVVDKTEALEARIADSVAKAGEAAEEMEEEEMVEEDSAITTTTIVETAVGVVVMEMAKGAGTVAAEGVGEVLEVPGDLEEIGGVGVRSRGENNHLGTYFDPFVAQFLIMTFIF